MTRVRRNPAPRQEVAVSERQRIFDALSPEDKDPTNPFNTLAFVGGVSSYMPPREAPPLTLHDGLDHGPLVRFRLQQDMINLVRCDPDSVGFAR
jgi:hypothetical protein